MADKKTSIIAILQILRDCSDGDHILSETELRDLVENKYGIQLDRRTIYRNINMLIEFGVDISTYKQNGKGYYLCGREFEESEIFLLCNAIHSSNYIPSNSSKELINKLLDTQSKYFRADFKNMVFVENASKKENKEFFVNIEMISNAIKNKNVISFDYLKYNDKKNLINKREEPYILSPYYIVYSVDKTYLVGLNEGHKESAHYRVDKIKNIKVIDKKYINPKNKIDPYEYAKNKIYMYSGNEEKFEIKFDEKILDNIIDTFGKDISIIKEKDNKYISYITSSKQGMIYFALQYIDYLEVISPISIRKEMIEMLNKGKEKYLSK